MKLQLNSKLFTLLCFCCLLFSCNEEEDDRIPTIVCTTGMVADMVKNIVGQEYKVISLMGPGVDPHLYKSTHGDLEKLQNAKYIIYNGLHLEGKLADILKKLSKIQPTYAVAEGLSKDELISGEATNTVFDPHIWFNVILWAKATSHCRNWLIEQEKEKRELYTNNAKIYIDKLIKLDQQVEDLINSIPKNQRVLITAHDAFSYFGQRYDIEVKGLQGISTQAEFGIRDVNNMVDFIIERGIKAIFVESSVSPKSIKAIVESCKEKEHKIRIGGTLYSDAMGAAGSSEGTYIGMVYYNANMITNALL